MKILAVNAGSSSLKVQLLEMPQETLIAKAQVERIGLDNAVVTVKYDFENVPGGQKWEVRDAVVKNHSDAVKAIMEKFTEFHIIDCVDDIKGVRFPIMNFYMWLATKYPVYGVVAENLEFIDVGKLDALKPAEEFVKHYS